MKHKVHNACDGHSYGKLAILWDCQFSRQVSCGASLLLSWPHGDHICPCPWGPRVLPPCWHLDEAASVFGGSGRGASDSVFMLAPVMLNPTCVPERAGLCGVTDICFQGNICMCSRQGEGCGWSLCLEGMGLAASLFVGGGFYVTGKWPFLADA